MVPGLETLRATIDRIDEAAARILAKRAHVAQRVALWKLLEGQPRRDPRRELDVRDHYARILQPAGWTDSSVDTLLATMMQASRDLQTHLHVAIQGGPGSWSEESLASLLPTVRPLHCATFAEAAEASETGRSVAAWLPVSNSTVGPVSEVAALAADLDGWIEVDIPIRHALIAPTGLAPTRVSRVLGHPRALGQCAATLARIVPKAELVATIDGAHAAASGLGANDAVVGSPRIAALHGLTVLAEGVADDPANATTFRLVTSRLVL